MKMSLIARFWSAAVAALGVERESEDGPRDREDRASGSVHDKLARWKRQLAEYERLGCQELARQLRSSIDAHERALSSRVA